MSCTGLMSMVHGACGCVIMWYDNAKGGDEMASRDEKREVAAWNELSRGCPDEAEYQRGINDTKAAQAMGPAGSEAREQAYRDMEAQWAREGFDG